CHELTSEALVLACIDRIRLREEDVQAWACYDPELALEQARARDRETPRSPLHGIPVGIKDVLDTSDMPSEYGSPIYRDHRPKADASCVALLRRAGCVILGKTVTTEFANVHPGKTRNPHNLEHTPGGSSSGSAAAVADRMLPLALGTQTGGSQIRPSAYCGIVGLKPTFNSINRAGLKFSAESLDTIGLSARTVEDIALGLAILSGRRAELKSERTAPLRVGLCRTPCWPQADEPSRENLERAASLIAQAGARVSEFTLPAGCERLFDEHGKVALFEAAQSLAWEYDNHRELLSASILAKLEEGRAVSRTAYDDAQALARNGRARLDVAMSDFDVLLTLSAPDEAPRGFKTTGSSLFNRIWTWLAVPCMNLPFGRGPNGLPLGVQLVGRSGQDGILLACAYWVSCVLPRQAG
ncbi:MAG: amidase, partial [Burkholderiales bacterium]